MQRRLCAIVIFSGLFLAGCDDTPVADEALASPLRAEARIAVAEDGGAETIRLNAEKEILPSLANPLARPDIPTIRCDYPVDRDSSAETLLRRFGDNAVRGTVMGREGEEYPGVILWPDDPGRRLDVFFSDPDLTEVEAVVMRENSMWLIAPPVTRNPEGGQLLIGIGSTIRDIERANLGPFRFYGFGWDFGGNIVDFMGGEFSRMEDCQVRASLAPVYEEYSPPDRLLGETIVESTDRGLDPDAVVVWEAGIYFDRE